MEAGKFSFIPKSSSDKPKQRVIFQQAGLSFFMKVSVFLFVASLLSFGGAYYYKSAIAGQIEDLTISLERAKAAFDPELINEIERLTADIAVAEKILGEHRLPSGIFNIIEDVAHDDVKFSRFDYSFTPSSASISGIPGTANKGFSGSSIRVTITGEAKDYTTLAEQSKIMENSQKVGAFSFSNFVLSDSGGVSFDLNMVLNPTSVFKR